MSQGKMLGGQVKHNLSSRCFGFLNNLSTIVLNRLYILGFKTKYMYINCLDILDVFKYVYEIA